MQGIRDTAAARSREGGSEGWGGEAAGRGLVGGGGADCEGNHGRGDDGKGENDGGGGARGTAVERRQVWGGKLRSEVWWAAPKARGASPYRPNQTPLPGHRRGYLRG